MWLTWTSSSCIVDIRILKAKICPLSKSDKVQYATWGGLQSYPQKVENPNFQVCWALRNDGMTMTLKA
jgi:hypothetical protein